MLLERSVNEERHLLQLQTIIPFVNLGLGKCDQIYVPRICDIVPVNHLDKVKLLFSLIIVVCNSHISKLNMVSLKANQLCVHVQILVESECILEEETEYKAYKLECLVWITIIVIIDAII